MVYWGPIPKDLVCFSVLPVWFYPALICFVLIPKFLFSFLFRSFSSVLPTDKLSFLNQIRQPTPEITALGTQAREQEFKIAFGYVVN